MARNLVPYGLLPNGNYGINLDNTTGDPRAAALEVLDTLPSVADPDNAPGRLVFSIADSTIFVYSTAPTTQWIALEGVPASIGPADPPITGISPPVTGSEIPGELYWTNDTEILFVWDGLQWQAAGGRYATISREKLYTGDGINITFATGTSDTIPSELVEVFIDGVRQVSLIVDSSGDYSIVGTFIVFVVPPVNDAEIFIRSFESIQLAQNATVVVPLKNPVIADNGDTDFPIGAAGVNEDSIYVIVDGNVKTGGTLFTVISISKPNAIDTEVSVITTEDVINLGLVPGATVTLIGAVEPEFVGKFTVFSVVGNFEFKVTVPTGIPTSATTLPGDVLQFSDSDYELVQQDTSIFSITKISAIATTATVTTNEPHGIVISDPLFPPIVTLGGATLENPDPTPNPILAPNYNISYAVTLVPSPTTFEVAVVAVETPISVVTDLPTSGDNNAMAFSPPNIGDSISFFLPLASGNVVDIRSFKNIVVAPVSGEANTLALAPGSSGESVVATPLPPVLNLKGIAAGANISVTSNATDVIITANTGANFESAGPGNSSLIQPGQTTSYVGVTDTTLPIVGNIIVDLSFSGTTEGRKITIKDSGGAAGTRNIEIIGPFGASFDGNGSLSITQDRGYVTLVYDLSNTWNIISEKGITLAP